MSHAAEQAREILLQMKIIDLKIEKLHAEGYSVEVDKLLEERQQLQTYIDVLCWGIIARS